MGIKRHSEPRPLQLSKRANVFYLEHARVVQQDDRIVYLTQDGGEFEQMFNIPERNTAFLLLGKGTSITDAAMRRMAASNVMVGFCGTGGSTGEAINLAEARSLAQEHERLVSRRVTRK